MTDLDLNQVKADVADTKAIPRDEQLSLLSQKCEYQIKVEDDIVQLEQELKNKKERLNSLSQVEIPDLMHSLGVSDFTLKNGLKVKVSAFYGAKIPEINHDEAFDWLENNGHEGIIKGEFVIMYRRPDKEKMDEFFKLATKMGFLTKDKLQVHPMTLKAFVKEQITGGQEVPRDLFGVYTGWQTKISKR